jgi:hypothetical protein
MNMTPMNNNEFLDEHDTNEQQIFIFRPKQCLGTVMTYFESP